MPNLQRKYVRPSKRRFISNQYTAEDNSKFVSASAKKLRDSGAAGKSDIEIDMGIGYVFLNFLTVFDFLSDVLVCKACGGKVKFGRTSGYGFAFKLTLKCECGDRLVHSSPKTGNFCDVNRRFMYAFRVLGMGLQSMKIFASLMDIQTTLSHGTYYTFLGNLYTAAAAVFTVNQKKAVKEEMEENGAAGNDPAKIAVSGDGSWRKRGFSSLFGMASLIGNNTGKILDVVVKSAFCQGCNLWASKQGTPEYDRWKDTHEEDCTANHQESAEKMEVDAIKEMFSRSEELLGVQYATYIGDGDSKTFKAIVDMDPYEDTTVHKKECVVHVQKRMRTRLRRVKKETKELGGKGQGDLTDKLIAELTVYYGLAIRRNSDSVEKMRDEIWATFHHKCSTNENPQHDFCPKGTSSWCKWRVAEAEESLDTFQHPPPLQENVQAAIRPVYEALSATELLQRCLGAKTQNSNESFNATVSKLAPKHLHGGLKSVETATYIAANVYNEGKVSLLAIMNVLGIGVGQVASVFTMQSDESRIRSTERRMSKASKEARNAERQRHIADHENIEIEEGCLYGPGIAY